VKWKKVGGKFSVALSFGENCTFPAVLIFSTKMIKLYALFLGHTVY
jgi:hypothetical protein